MSQQQPSAQQGGYLVEVGRGGGGGQGGGRYEERVHKVSGKWGRHGGLRVRQGTEGHAGGEGSGAPNQGRQHGKLTGQLAGGRGRRRGADAATDALGDGRRHGRRRRSVGRVLVQFPHVLLEVEVPAEALAADGTLEGLFVVVGVHVEGEVVDLMEGLVAHVAFVRLLARVSEFVVLVVALLVESLAAKLTHERLVPLVDPDVGVQSRRSEGNTEGIIYFDSLIYPFLENKTVL